MGVDLYTSFQKYGYFCLKNGGWLIHESTYTGENMVHDIPLLSPQAVCKIPEGISNHIIN